MDLPFRLLKPILKHVLGRLLDVLLTLLIVGGLLWAVWALWLRPAIDHEIAHAKQEVHATVTSSIHDAVTSVHLPWSKP